MTQVAHPAATAAYVVFPEQIADIPEAMLGGKASNLVRLARGGFPVPRWFAVTTSSYRDPEAALPEIIRAYNEGFGHADRSYTPVAVRSSAVGEDGVVSSFAGQMKTFLYVDAQEGFLEALQDCWLSAKAPHIAAYRAAHGLPEDAVEVAVVVQEMVPSDVSGVLFTANPTTGDRDEMVIRAAYGLGEGVVADLVETDGYYFKAGNVRSEIAEKAEMIARDPATGRGTVNAAVPEDRRQAPCLTDDQIRLLAETAARIAEAFGGPQDIEWAFAGGKLHILQTRPITTLKEPRTGRETVWDNSNITESYSGVTSALTFSFASNAYNIVYQQVCDLLGVPSEVIRANSIAYRNMLGLMKGRVFYNIKNWYRLVALLPGFEANKAFMEQMMGVKQKSDLTAAETRAGFIEKFGPLAMVGARVVSAFLNLDKLVDDFTRRFYGVYDVQRHRDLEAMSAHEIVEMYDLLEREILLHWKAPIVTDIFAMTFYGILKKLCQNWCGDTEGSLQNDLLCGEGGIESTEPTRALMRMAQALQGDPALRPEVEMRPAAELDAWLRETPGALRDSYLDFLDRFGFRCMNELKLEEPSLRDDPTFIFVTLKNYLKRPDLDVGVMEAREKEIRRRAEAKVDKILGFNLAKKAFFGWVLAYARKNVKNRENLRFARTKIFGLCREMFNEVGAKFVAEGLLDSPRDIYHLTVPEIWSFIEGRSTCTNLRGLAALRREEFDRYRQEDIPDRFTTLGLPYSDPMEESFAADAAAVPESDDPNVLVGVSCCPGEVTGPVRVILSPKDDMELNGQILVAERTDPGWVPLYPSAAGLLIERGSILSHSAIVARELGLPAIVGIKNLTKRVQDGQRVSMDARAGIVRLHAEHSAKPSAAPDPT
jgi:pyruvate,water dikinase